VGRQRTEGEPKSDGSRVTVKLDKDFNVTAVQDGMGSHK
jgi:hypothetical protein